MLGGTLCTEIVFEGLLDALKVPTSYRRHVLLDQPKIEDYEPIFRDLPPDTVVCGFSLGAIVAAHYADRMSAHRLILIGVNPFADDPANAENRHGLAKDVNALGGAAALSARAPEVFGSTPDQTRAMIYQMADTAADMIDAQTRLALTRPGAVPALARADMPVLAIAGAQDKNAPPNYGKAAAQAAPDGQFVALEGLGHFALLEDPIACATAVTNSTKVENDAN
ncbi:Alpha/beta hydrolase family protein [Flavimaricola marinus]|uniref:Alpha/beta hydrolase family protein n=1 Tax=Flavimaricola marinus TaxID=1819565 RepID=A0A238LL01_9RHOB|nr:Alpha/beta hydrolase family protein [Flavimaricola marinus]